jgi:hypothetical protein
MRLGAEDLAMEVAAVFHVRDLDKKTRGGHRRRPRPRSGSLRHQRDGTVNQFGRELDELAAKLMPLAADALLNDEA